MPALEEALRLHADYQVWVDRASGKAWWSTPEVADVPPIVLWTAPAAEAAKAFEDVLTVGGYLDRVGDGSGQEYVRWAAEGPVDVDEDYDVLGEWWELYRIDAIRRASSVGVPGEAVPPAAMLLDRELRDQQRQLTLRLGVVQAQRAANVRAFFGSDRGWLAAASRGMGLSHPTVREFVAAAERRREAQLDALEQWRGEQDQDGHDDL